MKSKLEVFVLAFFCAVGLIQADDLPEVVITATRAERSRLRVPQSAEVLEGRDLRTRGLARTLPDALQALPGVLGQKTARAQGSPFIRGFTGFRNLLLVDGVRLNNAVFRDGPNQYWGTVDAYSLGRVELLRGPAPLYGSDAVGGTVQAFTPAHHYTGTRQPWESEVVARYASADESWVGHVDTGGVRGHWGFNLGGTWKDFGDLKAGSGTGLQPMTGYKERAGDGKLEYFLDDRRKLVLAHQEYRQDDAERTHSTIFAKSFAGSAIGSDQRRSLDQTRRLTYLQYHDAGGGGLDGFKAGVSHQVQEEGEVRIKKDLTQDRQGFDVRSVGVFAEGAKLTSAGRVTLGADFYRDSVDSFLNKYNKTGAFTSAGIQGPVANDAQYDLAGIFLQDEIPLRNDWSTVLGARATRASAKAGRVQDPVTGLPISLTDDWTTTVFGARALYAPQDGDWSFYSGLSQAFRAPNLSDLTRFDIARSGELETPAPGLDPERFLSLEMGTKTENEKWRGELGYYYTWISDLIVRAPTGRTVTALAEVTKRNSGKGFVQGIEAQSRLRLSGPWYFRNSCAWMDGQIESFPTSAPRPQREPMSRLLPLTTQWAFEYHAENDRWWSELSLTLAQSQQRLSAADRADNQRIPPGGTPSYRVLSLRAGWRASRHLDFTAGLENLSDENYRIHGSGINEPGRNLTLGLAARI